MVAIKMYPAKDGDAFLIICDEEKSAFLIDGGYAETFRQHILPDLRELSFNGYRLRLVMATHIDSDHIGGLVDFFLVNGHAAEPAVITVDRVWHNSLRAMTRPENNAQKVDSREITDFLRRRYHVEADKAKPHEISARQGSSLAASLLAGDYHWNEGKGYQCICTGTSIPNLMCDNSLTILSPSKERISALCLWWRRQLASLGFSGRSSSSEAFDDAFEFFCKREASQVPLPHVINARTPLLERDYARDTSPTNGSSIAFSLVLNKKRILMLGDAWAEEVVTSLGASGASHHFDIIKISHHGSIRNTSPNLLKIIDAPVYLISTDGKKHARHPNLAVLKAIVDRPAAFTRTLYFNYANSASAFMKNYLSASGAQFRIIEGSTDWITL
ncbi:AVAST type 1 anti-phage system MBL fold metallo-hydrolase Avs1a [Erwinia piriflorinigrans]|uniref:Metallo-beta-lactamase domain-containing protein n=1 Tax=Erwinia piriflorinigrans CFBP 5888 TaxID=1161919 RepID=V5Z6B9_9GAMM|nr:AVAST type 1 anti-phage system MBL fold metallo-hydrolase Avs1a [Erwinia piriflorinigrans]CCG86504.1 hypothetical protein EPIR_1139 [Erwinia piriflorinigrans CFBP 5888]